MTPQCFWIEKQPEDKRFVCFVLQPRVSPQSIWTIICKINNMLYWRRPETRDWELKLLWYRTFLQAMETPLCHLREYMFQEIHQWLKFLCPVHGHMKLPSVSLAFVTAAPCTVTRRGQWICSRAGISSSWVEFSCWNSLSREHTQLQ